MGGSKSTSTSSSASGSGQAWAQPIANIAANNVQGVWNSNQGNTQKIASGVTGLLPSLMSNIGSNNANVQAAQGYNRDVLGGKFLSGNPFLQGQIDQTNRSVTDNVNSQFGTSGRYGSGAYAGLLTKQLADAENNLRYTDYNNQMGRMDAAAAQAPGLAQANYTGLPEILQASTAGASLPYTGMGDYASALSALFNGGTSTGTSTQSTSALSGILGGVGSLMSGAGSLGLKI